MVAVGTFLMNELEYKLILRPLGPSEPDSRKPMLLAVHRRFTH